MKFPQIPRTSRRIFFYSILPSAGQFPGPERSFHRVALKSEASFSLFREGDADPLDHVGSDETDPRREGFCGWISKTYEMGWDMLNVRSSGNGY